MPDQLLPNESLGPDQFLTSTSGRYTFVYQGDVAVFLANLGNYPLGLFPTRLLVISSIVALVEIVVATLVGAWLYKEEEVVSQAVHRVAA